MNKDIRSWQTFLATAGGVVGLLTAVFGYFEYGLPLIICAAIAILCIVMAAICFYYKPKKIKTPGILDIKAFRFKGQ